MVALSVGFRASFAGIGARSGSLLYICVNHTDVIVDRRQLKTILWVSLCARSQGSVEGMRMPYLYRSFENIWFSGDNK